MAKYVELSSADELAKLAELRDKGVLTAKEFEKQKRAVLSGKPIRAISSGKPTRRVNWGLLFVLIIIWIGWNFFYRPIAFKTTGAATLAACDSSAAKEVVKNAYEQNTTANVTTIQLLSLDQIREVSYDAQKIERLCSGRATLNSGEEQIQYRLFNRDGGLFVWVNP